MYNRSNSLYILRSQADSKAKYEINTSVTLHCDWWRKKNSCILVFNYLCNMAVIILHNISYSHPNVIQIKIFFPFFIELTFKGLW